MFSQAATEHNRWSVTGNWGEFEIINLNHKNVMRIQIK